MASPEARNMYTFDKESNHYVIQAYQVIYFILFMFYFTPIIIWVANEIRQQYRPRTCSE